MKIAQFIFFSIFVIFTNTTIAEILPYQSIQRPITSEKLFNVCASIQQDGTQRSRLCDIWDNHIDFLESKLAKKCVAAGEAIYKKIINVDGVVIKQLKNNRASHFHKQDKSHYSYVMPSLAKNYTVEEVQFTNGNVRHYSISNIRKGIYGAKFDQHYDNLTEATQRYELSYKSLTDQKEQSWGLYGDHTFIKDLESNKILAERKFYYYVIGKRQRLSDGQRLNMPERHNDFRYIATCENYSPKKLAMSKSGYPFTSYDFVSRVLIPKEPTKEMAKYIYSLSKGNGTKTKKCVSIQSIGPGIKPSDLKVTKIGKDVRISVGNTSDALICTNYFWQDAQHSLIFYNGIKWDEKQISQRGKLRSK